MEALALAEKGGKGEGGDVSSLPRLLLGIQEPKEFTSHLPYSSSSLCCCCALHPQVIPICIQNCRLMKNRFVPQERAR